MKNILIIAILSIVGVVSASAQDYHYQSPYIKSNGTYVQGSYQTNANNTKLDNWSTKGNVNPITGKPGTKSPYPSTSTSSSARR